MSIENQCSNLHTVLFLLSHRLPLFYSYCLSDSSPLLILFSECTDENPCEGLSRHATFDNFGMAFLTLFRVSTGDNWNGIMKVIFLPLLCCMCVCVFFFFFSPFFLFLKKMDGRENLCLCVCVCVCVCVSQSTGCETGVALSREKITVFMTA